jgi:hypothetical protein
VALRDGSAETADVIVGCGGDALASHAAAARTAATYPVPQQASILLRKGRAPLEILQRLARMASLEILADQRLEVGWRIPSRLRGVHRDGMDWRRELRHQQRITSFS